MNPFNLIVFAIASAAAMPQYGNNGGQSQPQTQKNCEWRTVVEYTETTRQDCRTEYNNKCSTLYKKVCTPYEDEVCETYQRDQCDQKQRTKYKTWSEDVCKDKYVNHCEKHWEEDSYGAKHWVDNKSTCKQIVDGKNCNSVERKEPYQEAYTDCYKVPDKKCRYVTKQNCKQQPYQDCKRVPYQECDDIHEKKPNQVRRRFCNGKQVNGQQQNGDNNGSGHNGGNNGGNDYDYDYDNNGGNNNGGNGSGSYTAQDVSDVFDERTTNERSSIGTKEVIGTRNEGDNEEEKDDDAISFGK